MAKSAEQKPLHELLPTVTLIPMGAPEKQENQGNLLAAKQSPAFPVAGGLISHLLSKRGERLLLDFTAQGCGLKFEVDGVWMNVDPYDRVTADAMLAVFKKIANLNPQDRRSKQEGKFGVEWPPGGKFNASITSQGMPAGAPKPTGERVLIKVLPKKSKLETTEQAGMRDKMREQFKAMVDGDHGLVVISAPAGGGLSTVWRIALQTADKFVRDFVSIEVKNNPEEEIINIGPVFFDPGQGPGDILERLLLKQPDVFIVPDMVNGDSLGRLANQVNNSHKTVVTRVAAKDAAEAIMRLVALKAPLESLATALRGVLNSRLIRKLCDGCKQPYQPAPALLQKLGIPAGRVGTFYKEWIPPPPEQRVDARGRPVEIQICEKCEGIGFIGRTAVFELLTIDDNLRQIISKQPNLELIRRAAKQAGHRSLQEEAIVLVAQGTTSITELQRVFSGK